jgi:hypothetical protein
MTNDETARIAAFEAGVAEGYVFSMEPRVPGDIEQIRCDECGRWFINAKLHGKHDCSDPERHPFCLPYGLCMLWAQGLLKAEAAWKISDERG